MDKPRYGFARKLARKVLSDYKGMRPPIDLKLILAQKGYEYIELDTLLDDVDAIFLRDDDDGKVYAAVNANHHVHRQRFSLAHELGHILMNHDLSYYRPYITIDAPPTEKTHTVAEEAFEKEANAFAGELLVPLELLKEEFKRTMDVGQLAKVFWVSQQVAGIAVSNNMRSLYK